MNDHAKGLLLTFIGGMVLTIDIPLIMAADGGSWATLLVRSGCTMALVIVIAIARSLIFPTTGPLLVGKTGLIVAAIYGVAAITFTMAVFNTSAGNLVFILAFNSMFAALLGWLFLGERPAPATLVTMVVLIVAVGIIVSGSIGNGTLWGDTLAIITSLLLATAITVTRHSKADMGFAPMVGAVIPVVCAGAVIIAHDVPVHFEAPLWVILNGLIVLPLAFWCLATGPKYISGPEVAMFYLLETVLTPVWVWLLFGEVLSRETIIGGTMIIVALSLHSWVQLRATRRQRAAVVN